MGRAEFDPYGNVIANTIPLDLTEPLRLRPANASTPTPVSTSAQPPGAQRRGYRARFYDPLTGSFVQPDSIVPSPMDPRAWNRFSYVYGNPVNYTDPSGHIPIWDALDVAGFAWSFYDFYNDPTWGNAGWLALDTMGLLPIIPSVAVIRHGGKFSDSGKIDDIFKVLRSTEAGEEIYQKAAHTGELPKVAFGASRKGSIGSYSSSENLITLNPVFRNLPSQLAAPTLAHELQHRTRRWLTGSKLDEFASHKIQSRVWVQLRGRINLTNSFFRGTHYYRENEKILNLANKGQLMKYLRNHHQYKHLPTSSKDLRLDPFSVKMWKIIERGP